MINKQLDQITLDDLKQLQSNAVAESKTIDYKKTLPSDSDGEKREFLADISSFANTLGGDLIYGITDEKGVPKSIDGIEVTNADEIICKYENIIRDGIEPRIICTIRVVPVFEKKIALIFRVQKSWVGPHRVIFKEYDKFYARHSAGKYPLDTSELRIAFNLSHTLAEKINRFRTERIAQIVAGNLPLPFCSGGKIALHLIPLESFTPNYALDLRAALNGGNNLWPMYSHGRNNRINFEGVLYYTSGSDGQSHSYTQLYRNGMIEAVEGLMIGEHKDIPSKLYEKELIMALGKYLTSAKELGINMPIVIYLTLIGVKGRVMGIERSVMRLRPEDTDPPIDRDILQLPETIVESYDAQAKDILRPMFDMIWNACGYLKSLNFDEAGNWKNS